MWSVLKDFGCENGRGMDLIRWGFFYDHGRLDQLKEHGTFYKNRTIDVKAPVTYSMIKTDPKNVKCSYDTYLPGHEFLPIYQTLLNNNPNLKGNSANDGIDNSTDFFGKRLDRSSCSRFEQVTIFMII